MNEGAIIGGVVKAVVEVVFDLIAKGHSAQEAGEIVQRNIRSLRSRYLAEKAEDDAALEEKHDR